MKCQAKIILILLACLLSQLVTKAQDVHFKSTDDFIEVYENDIIQVNADTAYVVSSSRVSFIDKRLDQLDSLKIVYNSLFDNREELLSELEYTQEVLEKISALLAENGSGINDDFRIIIGELDTAISDLKINNEQLKKNNEKLQKEIEDLHKVHKKLKKETRGIWWDGITDKIIVFAGGVGTGALLFLLL